MAETIGNLLRNARESRGMSLPQLSRVTRIPTASLVAIEANQFDALPAPVFVRGFVRSISRELRLDAADMLSLYDAQIQESSLREPVRTDDQPLAPLLFVSGGTETARYESHRGLQISHILLLVLALVTFVIAYVTAGMSTDKQTGPSASRPVPSTAGVNDAATAQDAPGNVRVDIRQVPERLAADRHAARPGLPQAGLQPGPSSDQSEDVGPLRRPNPSAARRPTLNPSR